MPDTNILYSEISPFADDLSDYIDSFNPNDSLPFGLIGLAGAEIVPSLLRSLAERDLRVCVGHNLSTVVKLHHASGGRMKRLIQTNDPLYHPEASSADTVVIALMRNGMPKGCVASRLVWCERSLAEEMESGRFWVSHPSTMWTVRDKCVVRAHVAKGIRSCHAVFAGSIFLAQDVTGGDTLAAMLRLHHLWVLCHWRWSWLLGIIEGALARRHAFDVYGAMAMDLGIWRSRPGEGEELHKYELMSCSREAAVESMLRSEMGDLSRPLGRPPVSVMPDEGRNADR
jgi:hypothetical protein